MERNYSLLLKISIMIFLAFVIILGNEIRIGVERYVTNTLETDASTNARNMEKIERVYIEDYLNTGKMQTSKFLTAYDTFLDDSSKIKCITDNQGNIIDISRPGFDDPVLHLVIDDKEIAYFDISSMHRDGVELFASYLMDHVDEEIIVLIDFVGNTRNQEDILHFDDIKVKCLTVNGRKIYENTSLTGKVSTYRGPIGYFSNIDYEMLYDVENRLTNSYFDGLDGEIVGEKVVVYDYSTMRKALENRLKYDFAHFVSKSDNFMNTSYSHYYLLDLMEDEEHPRLFYSTTMCKFIDWFHLPQNESIKDSNELENHATEGYCFVIQKYDHLYLDALSVFIRDNISTYSLTVLLLGLICIALGYMIIQPIRRIERSAVAISQKDFSVRLRSNRYDELGSLARSINTMGSELEKTIKNLHLEIDHVKQLEDLRKEFVSNFTHEIKTPLGIINGFSELIEIEEDEKKRNDYIKIIQQETDKINQLVLAMLDLSKLESKNISLNLTKVDLVQLCEDILDTMLIHIDNKKIQLEKDFHPYMLEADYQKMEMIITNLISNAIRYTVEGGYISITINDKGFYIENEGTHIEKEDLDKIWLAFHKGDKSRNEQGTGLGLAIVKASLDLHNMKYGVRNTKNGVLFYFEYK